MSEETNINITMSFDEYMSHARDRGQRFVTIDDNRRKAITSQVGWELECFIEEITPEHEELARLNKPVFKLWRLRDWQFHKETNRELVKEQRIADDKETAANHNKLMAWCSMAQNELIKRGKIEPSLARKHVRCCINPIEWVKIDEFEDDKDIITGEVIKIKETKLAEKIRFYYQLRTKLNWPFGNE